MDKLDDEGMLELPSEEQMCLILGLKTEDQTEEEEERNTRCGVGSYTARNGCEDDSGVIPIFQHLPGERMMYDRNNPVMKPGSLYHSMKEFRLTMRQYSIDKEFELGIKATDKRRYRGYCRGGDCPWSIAARVESKGWDPVIVTVLHDEHTWYIPWSTEDKCTNKQLGYRQSSSHTHG
jgi:hypothetical protein